MKLKHLALCLGLGLTALSLTTSCSKGEPTKPIDQRKTKHHDDPTKIVLKLTPVEVEEEAFASSSTNQLISYQVIVGENPITLTMEEDARGWTHTPSQLTVRSNATNPKRAYILQLDHYSAEGTLMNDQLTTPPQDTVHQYFFLHKESGNIKMDEADRLPWTYRYCDGKEEGGKLVTSDSQAIGIKGLIRFKSGVSGSTTLRLVLLHAGSTSKFVPSTGLPSPWYRIDPIKRVQESYDIDQSIPLKIQD